MAEMPESQLEGSRRNRQEEGLGASSAAAKRDHSLTEAMQLMEAVVTRENMLKAYARVKANKGSAGIDKMSVEQLADFLKEHWVNIKTELLAGNYQPQPVRKVEIPKPGGEYDNWVFPQ